MEEAIKELKLTRNQIKAELSLRKYERDSYKTGNTSFCQEQALIKSGEIYGLERAIRFIDEKIEHLEKENK